MAQSPEYVHQIPVPDQEAHMMACLIDADRGPWLAAYAAALAPYWAVYTFPFPDTDASLGLYVVRTEHRVEPGPTPPTEETP